MSPLSYAGIGSRETPQEVLDLMARIARWLRLQGFTLRSGGARGADKAFESEAGPLKQVFLADDVRTHDAAAAEIAEEMHPAWHQCSPHARRLHTRNVYQVLGHDLIHPSRFVACWTKDGGATGGTGQAIRIATAYGVPVFNLFDPGAAKRLHDTVLGLELLR